MFPAHYFAPRYFPPRYFAEQGDTPSGTGVYFPPRYFASRYFAPRYFPGIESTVTNPTAPVRLTSRNRHGRTLTGRRPR